MEDNILNPLAPLIQKTASDITTNVQSQFSGAGRTPTSPVAQATALGQVAQASFLPLAFGQYDTERGRQLAIASQAPGLTAVGSQLENIQRQQNMAPALSLQQYAGLVSPIASGFPTSGQVNTRANPITTAAGGALIGSAIPNVGPLLGGAAGFIGGLL